MTLDASFKHAALIEKRKEHIGPRRVKTVEGMKVFHKPIGTPITPQMIHLAQLAGRLTPNGQPNRPNLPDRPQQRVIDGRDHLPANIAHRKRMEDPAYAKEYNRRMALAPADLEAYDKAKAEGKPFTPRFKTGTGWYEVKTKDKANRQGHSLGAAQQHMSRVPESQVGKPKPVAGKKPPGPVGPVNDFHAEIKAAKNQKDLIDIVRRIQDFEDINQAQEDDLLSAADHRHADVLRAERAAKKAGAKKVVPAKKAAAPRPKALPAKKTAAPKAAPKGGVRAQHAADANAAIHKPARSPYRTGDSHPETNYDSQGNMGMKSPKERPAGRTAAKRAVAGPKVIKPYNDRIAVAKVLLVGIREAKNEQEILDQIDAINAAHDSGFLDDIQHQAMMFKADRKRGDWNPPKAGPNTAQLPAGSQAAILAQRAQRAANPTHEGNTLGPTSRAMRPSAPQVGHGKTLSPLQMGSAPQLKAEHQREAVVRVIERQIASAKNTNDLFVGYDGIDAALANGDLDRNQADFLRKKIGGIGSFPKVQPKTVLHGTAERKRKHDDLNHDLSIAKTPQAVRDMVKRISQAYDDGYINDAEFTALNQRAADRYAAVGIMRPATAVVARPQAVTRYPFPVRQAKALELESDLANANNAAQLDRVLKQIHAAHKLGFLADGQRDRLLVKHEQRKHAFSANALPPKPTTNFGNLLSGHKVSVGGDKAQVRYDHHRSAIESLGSALGAKAREVQIYNDPDLDVAEKDRLLHQIQIKRNENGWGQNAIPYFDKRPGAGARRSREAKKGPNFPPSASPVPQTKVLAPKGGKWTGPQLAKVIADNPNALYVVRGPNGAEHRDVQMSMSANPGGGGDWAVLGQFLGAKQKAPRGKVWMKKGNGNWKLNSISLFRELAIQGGGGPHTPRALPPSRPVPARPVRRAKKAREADPVGNTKQRAAKWIPIIQQRIKTARDMKSLESVAQLIADVKGFNKNTEADLLSRVDSRAGALKGNQPGVARLRPPVGRGHRGAVVRTPRALRPGQGRAGGRVRNPFAPQGRSRGAAWIWGGGTRTLGRGPAHEWASHEEMQAQDDHFKAGGGIESAPAAGLWDYLDGQDGKGRFTLEENKGAGGVSDNFWVTDNSKVPPERWMLKRSYFKKDIQYEQAANNVLEQAGFVMPHTKWATGFVGQDDQWMAQRDLSQTVGGGAKAVPNDPYLGGYDRPLNDKAVREIRAGSDPGAVARMIVFDYIINNRRDRHHQNFLLMDQGGGRMQFGIVDEGLAFGGPNDGEEKNMPVSKFVRGGQYRANGDAGWNAFGTAARIAGNDGILKKQVEDAIKGFEKVDKKKIIKNLRDSGASTSAIADMEDWMDAYEWRLQNLKDNLDVLIKAIRAKG